MTHRPCDVTAPHLLSLQLFYLVSVGLCVAVIVAFQLTAFTFRENLAATALLLALFGYVTRNAAAELRFVFRERTPPGWLGVCRRLHDFLSVQAIMLLLQEMLHKQAGEDAESPGRTGGDTRDGVALGIL